MSHDPGGAYVAQGVPDGQAHWSPPGQVYLDRAEEIYYAAISHKYTCKEACIAAKWLQFECPDAAEYLFWLLLHKAAGRWPKVKGNKRDGAQTPARKVVELETALKRGVPEDSGRERVLPGPEWSGQDHDADNFAAGAVQ